MERVEFETCTKDKIIKSFAELSKYGYFYEDEVKSNGHPTFLFRNNYITLDISTCYHENNKWKIIGALPLYIKNNLTNEWFNIEDYFTQYKGIDYKDIPFDDRIYDTDNIEQQIDNYLKSVINILQTELLDVITGKKWIHVPMDWYGAK